MKRGVRVTERTGVRGLGCLLVGCGVLLGCLAPRDGLPALLMGVVLVLAGGLLLLRRPGHSDDLEEADTALRAEIRGHRQPAGADADGGPPRSGFETATRLTNLLHGDEADSAPAMPAGWSLTNVLLPAPAVLSDGTLEVRRRRRVAASIPLDSIGCLLQVSWKAGLASQHPAVEMWVVGRDGRPLAVTGWDTRIERQVRDAGLPVRRFAHSIDRDVIAHAWPDRPARPVAVHVGPAARR